MTEQHIYSPAMLTRLVEIRRTARLLAAAVALLLYAAVFDGVWPAVPMVILDTTILVGLAHRWQRTVDRTVEIAHTRACIAREVGQIMLAAQVRPAVVIIREARA